MPPSSIVFFDVQITQQTALAGKTQSGSSMVERETQPPVFRPRSLVTTRPGPQPHTFRRSQGHGNASELPDRCTETLCIALCTETLCTETLCIALCTETLCSALCTETLCSALCTETLCSAFFNEGSCCINTFRKSPRVTADRLLCKLDRRHQNIPLGMQESKHFRQLVVNRFRCQRSLTSGSSQPAVFATNQDTRLIRNRSGPPSGPDWSRLVCVGFSNP